MAESKTTVQPDAPRGKLLAFVRRTDPRKRPEALRAVEAELARRDLRRAA